MKEIECSYVVGIEIDLLHSWACFLDRMDGETRM
jgi:hypothetical protein